MRVNFFDTKYREAARRDKLFGICDDQNGKKAYTDVENKAMWTAQVINNSCMEIAFTPIDNCISIFKEGTNDRESTCDGMLTFPNSLFLVELKEKTKGGSWIAGAKKQLENTIKLLCANHCIDEFGKKKAYVCNKRHPYFRKIDNSEQKDFFKKNNGFRLDIQANIIIK
jgi:hypothetical protein